MPVSTIAHGKTIAATFTPDGGSEQAICITDIDFNLNVDEEDVTNSCSGGVTTVIAGISNATGTITGNYDPAAPPHALAVGGRPGVKGLLKLTVAPGKVFHIPIMIKATPYRAAVRGKVTFTWEFTLTSDAGTFAFPT